MSTIALTTREGEDEQGGLLGFRDSLASILVDSDHRVAIEGDEQAVRRQAVDPILFLVAFFFLADFAVRRAFGRKHGVVVHADQDLVLLDRILELGRRRGRWARGARSRAPSSGASWLRGPSSRPPCREP